MTQRMVKEGRVKQGVRERLAYTVTTTPWGTTPSNVLVSLFDITGGSRVDSSSKLVGQPSVTDDVITSPVVSSLVVGHVYRMEFQFVCAGNTFEAFAEIEAEE